MIGLLLIVASWLALRLERKGLRELGFDQPRRRSFELLLGVAIMGSAAAIQKLGFAAWGGGSWQLNPEFTWSLLLERLRPETNSVLFEELVFRGYLLYQLLRFTGRGALWISAAAFGVYHWFSFGVLGNVSTMVFVLFYTGAFGWVAALAFRQTGSIAAPIGLHLGWNLVSNVVFSFGPLGETVLVPSSGWGSLVLDGAEGPLLGIVWPLAVLALIGWWLLRSKRNHGIQAVRIES